MKQTNLIMEFNKISKKDVTLAGGKGASLGEMTQNGIPVPPGFVIVSTAFDQFIEDADIKAEIDTILHTVKHTQMHTIENASKKIQAIILRAKMSPVLMKEIQQYFTALKTEFVAVRSSATAEDSSSAAWAGQLDTFLNTTERNLLENVKKCWASLFTPWAIFYRFEQNLHTQKISVAVVVQKMVNSEIAGIAFSVHPVTQDRNQLIIEAGYGLGEAVVSGQITPDSYVVEKKGGKIIDVHVAKQEKALYRKAGGGNEWKELPVKQKEKQKLISGQILELAKMIIKIEQHYGFPCDIEWAFEKGRFYITQSRPITTLKGKEELGKKSRLVLTKSFTREIGLLHCQLWASAVCKNSQKWVGRNIAHQLFFSPKGDDLVTIWYENKDLDAFLQTTKLSFINNPSLILNLKKHFKNHTKKCKPYFEGKTPSSWQEMGQVYADLQEYFNGLAQVFDIIDLDLPQHIQKIALHLRKATEHYSKKIDQIWYRFLALNYPRLYKYRYVLGFEDLAQSSEEKLIPILQMRLQGYGLYNGSIYVGTELQELLSKKINLEEKAVDTNVQVLSGWVACRGGRITGRVAIAKRVSDLQKVCRGDILCVIATSPEYVPAMKKAAAIIADEGGITCHAAIIARELKKPCIIGTKIATQVLKDGDLVEVDANKGIVKILKK